MGSQLLNITNSTLYSVITRPGKQGEDTNTSISHWSISRNNILCRPDSFLLPDERTGPKITYTGPEVQPPIASDRRSGSSSSASSASPASPASPAPAFSASFSFDECRHGPEGGSHCTICWAMSATNILNKPDYFVPFLYPPPHPNTCPELWKLSANNILTRDNSKPNTSSKWRKSAEINAFNWEDVEDLWTISSWDDIDQPPNPDTCPSLWERSKVNILNLPNTVYPFSNTWNWSLAKVYCITDEFILLGVWAKKSGHSSQAGYGNNGILIAVLLCRSEIDSKLWTALELDQFISAYHISSPEELRSSLTSSKLGQFVARVLKAKPMECSDLYPDNEYLVEISNLQINEAYVVVSDIENWPLLLPPRGGLPLSSLTKAWLADAGSNYVFSIDNLPPVLPLEKLNYISDLHEDTLYVVSINTSDEDSKKEYVYKTVNYSDDYRFLYHEIRVLITKAPHTHIIPAPSFLVSSSVSTCPYSDGQERITGYLTPFLPGQTLDEALCAEDPSVSLKQRLTWLKELAFSLVHNQKHGYGHGRPSFHSDLKPNNVRILFPTNKLILLDFEQRGNWWEYLAPEVRLWPFDFEYICCRCTNKNTCETCWRESFANITFLFNTIVEEKRACNYTRAAPKCIYGRLPFWNLASLDQKESAVVFSLGRIALVVLDKCGNIEDSFIDQHGHDDWRRHIEELGCFKEIPERLTQGVLRMVRKNWRERPRLMEVARLFEAYEAGAS